MPNRPVPDDIEDEVRFGYDQLTAMEFRFAEHAWRSHRPQIIAWMRLLSLAGMVFTGPFHLDDPPNPPLDRLLRLQLLAGVGIGTSKLALDAALAGYYAQSFAQTRHMLESWGHAAYVRVRPDETYRWYGQPGDPRYWTREPSFDSIRKTIKKHTEPRDLVDRVDGVIKLLNKGAHPSGELLSQTTGVRPGQYVVGPNYDQDLAAGAFHFGTYATVLILTELMEHVVEKAAWGAQLQAAIQGMSQWLQEYLSEEEVERPVV